MLNTDAFLSGVEQTLKVEYQTTLEAADAVALHGAVGRWAMGRLYEAWSESRRAHAAQKSACYLSAEFLMGRMVFSNLYSMGVLEEARAALAQRGVDLAQLEQVEDDALGNGGLGRLAACYLDSAATHSLPLDGFGIRYRYGLFRQGLTGGRQTEAPDDWQAWGDPWSVRRAAERVLVEYADETVVAVPYDMPVVGCGARHIGTLRLWQAEALEPFDFDRFNRQEYEQAVHARTSAETISAVLYPNDDTPEGKALRLRQQYFFASASIQDLLRRLDGRPERFALAYAVQLNDTHPVIAIPELIRLLLEQGFPFADAFALAQQAFSYTNHTVMPEAMETWDAAMMKTLLPRVYQIIRQINERLLRELRRRGMGRGEIRGHMILAGGRVHMARLAAYVCHHTNGVARIHTEILKSSVLRDWHRLYPERFCNVTNGVTQRRWLGLCNPELAAWITRRLGSDGWLIDLSQVERLRRFADDPAALQELAAIKENNKRRLCRAVQEREGVRLDPSFLFDVQIKRLHEYKRQFLNALSILDLYFGLKDGTVRDFTPTAFLFGAKAAPGYHRAKGIIQLICEIGKLIACDNAVADRLQVVFVQNYNVSYAELLIPAADVSEQISTAGTEASGTGNMKLALNGAVTLGTYDGANIEIVEQAGAENNYIFGRTVEELAGLSEEYDPFALYEEHPRIRRVLDALVDGTLDDGGSGAFQDLYESILAGASWHRADQYYLLEDFLPYADARLRVNADYRDRLGFARKCLLNIAGCGHFSSDRSVREYAEHIWGIRPCRSGN